MQLKTSALLFLASIASVIAKTPGEKLDDTLDSIDGGVSEVLGPTSVLGNIKYGATSVVGDIQGGATSVTGEIKDYITSVGNDFKSVLPTITAIPSNVDGFFNSVGSKVENLQIPTTAWSGIETGLYPPEVSQWVNSLPTTMRAEASQKLTEWAGDVGNTANAPNRGAVVLEALAVACVLALAMAL